MSGWFLTDPSGEGKVWPNRDSANQLSIPNQDARRYLPKSYYWSAPERYLGNKVSLVPLTVENKCCFLYVVK